MAKNWVSLWQGCGRKAEAIKNSAPSLEVSSDSSAAVGLHKLAGIVSELRGRELWSARPHHPGGLLLEEAQLFKNRALEELALAIKKKYA